MIFMYTYCFYFSVRLGVIFSTLTVIAQEIALLVYFNRNGDQWLIDYKTVLENDETEYEDFLLRILLFFTESEYIIT